MVSVGRVFMYYHQREYPHYVFCWRTINEGEWIVIVF